MVRSWNIASGSGQCLVCQRVIPGGERFVSALYPLSGELSRRDFCPDCFAGYRRQQGEPFSYWQGRTPAPVVDDEEAEVIPRDTLLEIFQNAVALAASGEAREKTFVLGMVLLRRKGLKAVGSDERGLKVADPGGDEYLLADPGLSESELEQTLQSLEGSVGCRLLPA